jgi:hypothetical protein
MKQPILSLTLGLLALAGCTEHLPLVGAPCPCAPSTTCDMVTQQCIPLTGAEGYPDAGEDGPALRPDVVDPTPQVDALRPDVVDPSPQPEPSSPAACKTLEIESLIEFETKFIAPRCGQAKCHGNPTVFHPKNLDMPKMIRATLVGKNGQTLCKDDFYVNKADPERSFVLAKIRATGETLTCPTDIGVADSGGVRMPNKDGMPGLAGKRLTQPEIDCFTWWVYEVAKL